MLRPRDTATRERKSLNGLWHFALDSAGEGRSAGWFTGPLPNSREMAVPASFNDIVPDADVRDYFGDVWYQTSVRVPPGWAGSRNVLNLDRHPPRHGVGGRRRSDLPRGRLHTVRGGCHRAPHRGSASTDLWPSTTPSASRASRPA